MIHYESDSLGVEVLISYKAPYFGHASKDNVPIETFTISFEGIQKKQHYATRITCTVVMRKCHGE